MNEPPTVSDAPQSPLHGTALPNTLHALHGWHLTLPGSAVALAELSAAREILPNIFGYHLLQVGHCLPELLDLSRISHRVLCEIDVGSVGGQLAARADAWPIATNSVDAVILPHTLEFVSNAHAVLREAERVLIGEGSLVVLGFNPWSLFGVYRQALGWRGIAPWSGRFLSLSRIKDWLELLSFDLENIVRVSYRLPLRHPRWHRRGEFIERLGQHFWPVFSNIYLVHARKRVVSLRPIRAALRSKRLATGGIIEPTARSVEAHSTQGFPS